VVIFIVNKLEFTKQPFQATQTYSMEYSSEFRSSKFFLETKFGIKTVFFEAEAQQPAVNLERVRMSYDLRKLTSVRESERVRRSEAVVDRSTKSLYVFPSDPKYIGPADFAPMTLPAIAFLHKIQPDIVMGLIYNPAD
jgi:hypothetical protein